MNGFQLRRLGVLMEPEPDNPMEAEGVLNPAAVRGPDGELYLFPRLVAHGNYSRIGIARVRFNDAGDPFRIAAAHFTQMDRTRSYQLVDQALGTVNEREESTSQVAAVLAAGA